ncbi:hypothetical protein DdX_21901 [Ditylenchus destructor]|uniref:Uncharacterized protein n=1 Tax=Ditylenchus destructor TaxID=166010 RepID=A0AAD4MEB4_9BILA|nr:hypothetical protein DdX_21901 [Ditylenchus destructor]
MSVQLNSYFAAKFWRRLSSSCQTRLMHQEEITTLHGSVRVLEELIKSQEVVFEALRYKAQKLQEEHNQCKVRYKMKMSIVTLKTELTSLDTTCDRLSSDHHTAMTQLERVSHAQALASQVLQKKTRELDDALEICTYEEEKLDEKQVIIENLEKTMSDKDNEIQLLTQENRTLSEENEDIKTKLPKTLQVICCLTLWFQKHKEKSALPARGIKPATGADRIKTSTADPKDRTKNVSFNFLHIMFFDVVISRLKRDYISTSLCCYISTSLGEPLRGSPKLAPRGACISGASRTAISMPSAVVRERKCSNKNRRRFSSGRKETVTAQTEVSLEIPGFAAKGNYCPACRIREILKRNKRRLILSRDTLIILSRARNRHDISEDAHIFRSFAFITFASHYLVYTISYYDYLTQTTSHTREFPTRITPEFSNKTMAIVVEFLIPVYLQNDFGMTGSYNYLHNYHWMNQNPHSSLQPGSTIGNMEYSQFPTAESCNNYKEAWSSHAPHQWYSDPKNVTRIHVFRNKKGKADASSTKSKSSSTKNDERNLQEAAIEPNPRLLQGHYGIETQLNSQSSTKSTKTLLSTSNDTPKPGNATKTKKKWVA